jgi:hypothetical protein
VRRRASLTLDGAGGTGQDGGVAANGER